MNRDSRSDSPRGAKESHNGIAAKFSAWLHHHKLSAKESWVKMMASPVQSIMTSLVIAIALALPASLQVTVDNFQQLSDGIESTAQITIYLKKGLSNEGLELLQDKLNQNSDIAESSYLSAGEALSEFQALSGLGDVLNLLDDNPLPAVIMVQPVVALSSPERLDALVLELNGWGGVDDVRLDMKWVQRLHAILEIGRRIAIALGLSLALGVLLVIGNTIRLAVQNRRDEIVVVKLVGGTDGYVRRPFLYTGLWYGCLGGFTAWVLVWAGLMWLTSAVGSLSSMYQSGFVLTGLGFVELLALLATGAVLGLIGAWVAVGKHLREIEPE
jgi:cell division transport system permease protein